MGQLFHLVEYRRGSPRVFFDRHELLSIHRIYTEQVSLGLWRDYAIDYRHGMALFSIFRKARELPLFSISKSLERGESCPKFTLHSRNRKIATSKILADILDILSKEIALTH